MSRFSIPFDQIAATMEGDLHDVVRKSTVLLFQGAVNNAPVDTGRFRANMNVGYNEIDRTATASTDQTRAITEVRRAATLPVGGVVYLTNSLPYADVIENGGYPNPPKHPTGKTEGGYSIQAPRGVFRIAAIQFSDYVKDASKK